jgi:hypothetical protein
MELSVPANIDSWAMTKTKFEIRFPDVQPKQVLKQQKRLRQGLD